MEGYGVNDGKPPYRSVMAAEYAGIATETYESDVDGYVLIGVNVFICPPAVLITAKLCRLNRWWMLRRYTMNINERSFWLLMSLIEDRGGC